jgi:hypothetical protein
LTLSQATLDSKLKKIDHLSRALTKLKLEFGSGLKPEDDINLASRRQNSLARDLNS